MAEDTHSFATRIVQAGRPPHRPDEPLNPPITMASVFVGDGEREYGRSGNPTWQAFEAALGNLEGGLAVALSSGVAAQTTILDLVDTEGVVVAPRHSYSGLLNLLNDFEGRGRFKTRLVDIANLGEVRAALDDDVALMWIESPTNPAMEMADIEAIVEAAHALGITVVVDNTFATPVYQRPLELCADLVVHSVTKFLSGHSDLIMGALVCASSELEAQIRARRTLTGSIPGPFETWLALRGLRTLGVRMERASANAAALAERLDAHPAIQEVRYPGFGAVLSVVLANAATAERFTHGTSLWVHATSLGGVESTLERRRRWPAEPTTIPDGLVRLSVGIENVDDLWDDLEQSLTSLTAD